MTPEWVLPTVIIITFLVSLSNQVINFKFTDQAFIKKKRAEMKALQSSINANSSKEDINKVQGELMKINNELSKHMMKPTMYTFIPLLGVFWALSNYFKPYGDLITLPFAIPLFGAGISWLGTYIIFSFVFSLTIKPLVTRIGEKYGKGGVKNA